MKFLFKIIVVFLIVFSIRIPYVYNTVFLAIIITTVFYIFNDKKLPFTYFFQRYNAVILIGTVLIALVIYAFTVFHSTYVYNDLQKRMWVELQMLAAMIYALPLLLKDKETNAFDDICVIICYVFALQGLIHLIAYLYEPLGEYFFEMKPESIKQMVLNPRFHVDRFRLYCLSGIVFVELVAAYGITFMLYFRLQLNSSSHPYLKGWVNFVVFFFIIIGTMLAGRTGFVGLALGFLLWVRFQYKQIVSFLNHNIMQIILVLAAIFFAYNFLLPAKQRKMFNDEVFPFAFEWYYNYRDYGTFSIQSLEGTESHYFPLRDETFLKGHGGVPNEYLNYSNTDAGYMNNILFGGIPYVICLIIYQSLYFILPLSIAGKKRSLENRVDAALFMLFFAYIFLLSYKTTAIGTIHIVETLLLAAGSTYLIRYYSSEELNK